ncbi:MAG: homoserine dehydrogenase [Candidatus Gastranaerophilaceae bacterium]|jgi:homoserine dehydrogenase
MSKVINVGLLGLGTVGRGVYKVLQNFGIVKIKKISVKNLSKKRNLSDFDETILTEDAMSIVTDKSIDIIVEVIGGVNTAYNLVKEAIINKKHVVTANKELIAKHGHELFELAKENDVVILYEAAVAGGIPIIMPFKTALCANKIDKIAGILNGTTNFILSKMESEGAAFDVVLKEAQELGYAEADPTGDIQGYDAAYKVAILASLAFNKRIEQDQIYREGIDKLTPFEFKYADELGYKIKLIAMAKQYKNKFDVRVHPMLVSKKHPLAHINGVLNAIVLEGYPVGQIMFSGPGAGELPTASSVSGDVLALADELQFTSRPLPMMRCKHQEHIKLMDINETVNKYYVTIVTKNVPGVIGHLGTICGNHGINVSSIIQKEILPDGSAMIVILTEESLEKNMKSAIDELSSLDSIKKIYNIIRVMDI